MDHANSINAAFLGAAILAGIFLTGSVSKRVPAVDEVRDEQAGESDHFSFASASGASGAGSAPFSMNAMMPNRLDPAGNRSRQRDADARRPVVTPPFEVHGRGKVADIATVAVHIGRHNGGCRRQIGLESADELIERVCFATLGA